MEIAARVLYTDNHLIAVNKLPGEIVQGDKTGDIPLSEQVAEYLSALLNKPGKAFIGVIHRIDRPVSGLVLLARTSKGLSRLNEQFRERKVQKTYFALVEGKPSEIKATLIHYLLKNEAKNTSKAHNNEVANSLRSELSYEVVEVFDRYTLLEVKPITGRHHQIRAQLSAIGHPIKGDVKYGARRGNSERSICLHARTLSFNQPVTGDRITVSAKLPGTDSWLKLEI
jgi:23S rRNA pseudouridine1911/1915/1917 synthase